MYKSILAFCIVFMVMIVSCNKTTNEQDNNSSQAIDSLKMKLTALNDSVDLAWKVISVADSQKFADLDRLLDEVSYTKKPDEAKLNILREKLKSLQANQLTQETMLVSANIDNNDILVDSIVREIILFASTTPRAEDYPLIAELIDDINTANSADAMVVNRVKYDKMAFIFNEFIEKNKQALNSLAEKLRKTKPTFAVNPPQM